MLTLDEAALVDELDARRDERRRAHDARCVRRRFAGYVALAALVLGGTAAGLVRAAEAATRRPAPPAIQRPVDRLVGHHVPRLLVACRGRTCVATTPDGMLVVNLVERDGRWVVRSAIA